MTDSMNQPERPSSKRLEPRERDVSGESTETGASPDEELIRRTAAGDHAGFTALVHRYQAPFFRMAIRMVRDPALAEDCVQTAFLNVFRGAASYRPGFAARSWLFRILINASVDTRRRGLRETPHEDVDTTAPARRPGLRIDLQTALDQLPNETRAVFLLRTIEDLPYAEIARIRGVSVNTVKTQLSRARRTLRAALEDEKEDRR